MDSWKHLGRIVSGLSLVAKEMANRSASLQSMRKGNLEALIKAALSSATDISGLTKGDVREVSRPKSGESSVVFFETKNEADLENDNRSSVPADVQVSREDSMDHSNSNDPVQHDAAEMVFGSHRNNKSDSINNLDGGPNLGYSGSVKGKLGAGTGGVVEAPSKRRKPRERRVPSTPFTRALGFAGLGAGLAWGTLQESTKRLVFGSAESKGNQAAYSPFLSEKNAERLALGLCRMRGAALKVGQMLSIQDESLVPAPILAALDIVRQGADVMPKSQLNQVLDAELGSDWQSKLTSFDYEPMAAASIGQVHRATTKNGFQVAMKIQYPGVANSIESDIENVKLLLNYTNLIPEGLYLDRAIKVAKEELSRECNYEIEAANQKRFRDLLGNVQGFYVPIVVDELSREKVLSTELVYGITIDKVALLDQETRDYVGRKLLELTLTELFVFRFMQTDPNWGNFLYEETSKTINLIDFGAAREYQKSFVDDYLRMVVACANQDRDAVIEMSRRLGFITGMESDIMLDAHVQAGFVVGLPFSKTGLYDFRSTNITQSITNLGAKMLKHRLTPPPDAAYSLHRKLSGAFLACIKLGAVVPCRKLLLGVYERYQFGEEESGESLSTG